MRQFIVAAIILHFVIGSGCTARQIGQDGNNFRVAVCDLYTEQAMDNLIRAKSSQPFVQLVYRDLLAQTTDTASGEMGLSSGLERMTGITDPGRKVISGLTLGGSGSRERQLSFHADPVIDRPEVYDAFIEFAHNPDLFVESDSPPHHPVHIHRKRHKKHYWVPCEAGSVFLSLVLNTSFRPASEPPVSPAYDVEIERVLQIERPPAERVFVTVKLKFKDPVPRGEGTLILKTVGDDRRIRLEVFPDPKSQDAEGVSVDELKTQFNPTRLGIEPDQLVGLKGQLFSYKFPKSVPPPSPPIGQKIYNDLDRIRSNTR